jgi:hypothetical protein
MRANASETRARKMIWKTLASTDTSRARPRGAARDERETQTRSGRGAI